MRSNMKTTKTLLFGVAVAATVATTQNVRADNLASAAAAASATVHRLIVASPHGLEEFPWLLREPSPQIHAAARSESVLANIKKNRAFAASPRVREQFPELDRGGWSSTGVPSKPANAFTPPEQVLKNRAWAASPRVKEEYPWLARGYAAPPVEKSIQVAPLK